MKAFPWLLRRELWEHRSIYLVPLIFLSLLVVMYTWGLLSHGPGGMMKIEIDGGGAIDLQQLLEEEPEARTAMKLAAGGLPFIVPTALLNIAMLFVWFFYLTDTLYAERKDRSVSFWKSLPVDDTTTVLSKLFTAMAVIPAITFAGVLVAAVGMTLANTVFAWTIGQSAWQLIWSQLPFISAPATLLYAFAVQSLWYAPVFAWLLLASAWARRAPALWALLPPAGIALIEGATLHSSNFAELIGKRLTPIVPTAYRDEDIEPILDKMHYSGDEIEWSEAFGSLIDPQSFLAEPGMWVGLVFATVFVAGAIWLRRYRDDS
ncbi:MAG: ABC-2 transporter permease [Gammaproteobacteria bacterium]|nr:ABC-2 transporter permease [Gammaproteobacteria bacterium]